MSNFPGSPRLLKGAIVGLDPVNPPAGVIMSQYNPDTVTRALPVQGAGAETSNWSEALGISGLRVEMAILRQRET